jgi:spermidine synthase
MKPHPTSAVDHSGKGLVVDQWTRNDVADAHRPPPLPARAAAIVVFLAAGAVLVLEIAAIRLVAPYVGLTLETNSAVIGTALGAIAVGAWTGGRLADEREAGRLLAPLLIGGGVLTMLSLPIVRHVGALVQGTPDAQVVLLLAMVTIFAPVALLSAVSPMVVKLQLTDLGQTGTVVGRLSGIGTLGAIIATFMTGFVLLAVFPTTAILIGAGAVAVITGIAVGWHQRGRNGMTPRAGSLALLPFAPLLVLTAPDPCDVETEYHCARVEVDPGRPTGRVLWLDTLRHSYVDLSDPTYLEFAYVRGIASAADALRPANEPIRALHIGGGGFTLPRYLAATRPGTTSTVLEIDGGIVALDRRELGVDAIPDLSVTIGDARTSLAAQPAGVHHLVVGDAFGGIAVPWHLTTRETAEQVSATLREDGVYAVNVIDYPPGRFVRAQLATLRAVFPHVAIMAGAQALAGTDGGNHVLLASRTPVPLSQISEDLQQRQPGWQLLDETATARFAGDASVLRDDFAPVDQLITH